MQRAVLALLVVMAVWPPAVAHAQGPDPRVLQALAQRQAEIEYELGLLYLMQLATTAQPPTPEQVQAYFTNGASMTTLPSGMDPTMGAGSLRDLGTGATTPPKPPPR